MTYYSESSLFRKVINFIEPILKEMKMRASKKIENVQLVLPLQDGLSLWAFYL
jgi:hypothetical protein